MARVLAFAAVLIVAITSIAQAETPREITWDDLIPPSETIENPFLDMDMQLREDLGFIARTREDLRMEFISKDGEEYAEALAVEASLKIQGIDVDGLIQKANAIEEAYKAQESMLNAALDGKRIRMPGYALPLEYREDGITEFLLVPYVGACIHSPAPPLNQTVFVTLNQTYKMQSLFAPVWVTGRISAKQDAKELSFVDGAAAIQTGYTIEGVQIEPYEN